jgi:hypothetical protein
MTGPDGHIVTSFESDPKDKLQISESNLRIIKSRLLDIFLSMRRVKTAIIEITAKANHKSIPRAGCKTSIAGDSAIYAATKAKISQHKLTASHIMPCLYNLLSSFFPRYITIAKQEINANKRLYLNGFQVSGNI